MTPHVAAPIPVPLAERAEALIARIAAAEHPKQEHGAEATELLVEMTDVGLQSFFLRPVEILGLGSMGRSAVKLGLATSTKAISAFIRALARRMDDDQVRELAGLVEEMIVWVDGGEEP